jgi:hypothetical protein
LAWNAFFLRSKTIYWGKVKRQNTLRRPKYCNYPLFFAISDKESAKCGKEVNECIGRDGISISILEEWEDYEYCPEHQKTIGYD